MVLSSPPATAPAAAEIQSLGADKWNTSYYPTGADAAANHKQVGLATTAAAKRRRTAAGRGRGCRATCGMQ